MLLKKQSALHIERPHVQVYEGIVFKLSLAFPSDYPYSAPTVRFETPCYHPNVDLHGNICLDILKVRIFGPWFTRRISGVR